MENEQPINCFYCSKDLNSNEWESDWHDEKHYKFLKCECGKKNWCETDFISSGHSTIDEHLESVVRDVCDISCSK